MGEIGSLRNRIRQWRLNHRRQKEKEEALIAEYRAKLDQSEKKKTYQYTRFQVFTRTVFGLFLGFLETTLFATKVQKKREKKEQVLEQKVVLLQHELITVTKDIKMLKETGLRQTDPNQVMKLRQELPPIRHRVQNIEIAKQNIHQEVEMLPGKVKKRKKESLSVGDVAAEIEPSKESVVAALAVLDEQLIETKETIDEACELLEQKEATLAETTGMILASPQRQKAGVDNDPAVDVLTQYLKESHDQLKEFDRELAKYAGPIDDKATGMVLMQLSNLYDKIFSCHISELSMRKKYQFSKFANDNALKKLDKEKFLTSDSVFGLRLEKCGEKTRQLKEQQQQKFAKKEEEKQVIIKQQQKVANIALEKKKMSQKITQQRLMIESLQTSLFQLPPHKKKRGRLSRLGSLIKHTLFASLGIFTLLKGRKNAFGLLTGVLLTNQGIRGMRNMVKDREENVAYFDLKKIMEQLKTEKDALTMSIDFCADSLDQLQSLKLEFMDQFSHDQSPEAEQFLEELLSLEDNVMAQQEQLLKQQQAVDIHYEKGKQKILKMEERK